MSPHLLRAALTLGLLSAVGPFAIDMYLPAMPAIAEGLATTPQAVQTTVISYFLAFGLAQMIFGPWADQAGRKRPIYAGLGIFLVGSVICATAPTAGWLIFGRAVQGLGGAAVMVVPRAVIRDLATGHDATKMMAAIMVVISVSPFLAPLAGAGMIAIADWRAVFWALAAVTVISLLLTRYALEETLPAEKRVPFDMAHMKDGIRTLTRDRTFMMLTLLGGFGFASFFVFIATASFVYTEAYGLSPTGFGLAFAVNAAGFFASSQFAGSLGQKYGAKRVVITATAGFAAFAVGLFVVALAGVTALPVVMAGLFLANACLGLVIPTAMVLALDEHGPIAGLASSLGGMVQMLAGAAMAAIAAPFQNGTVTPMLGAIAACAALAFGFSRLIPRPQETPVQA
jgi:DHA1 family bicyclomycin/chloramphenicol resistance-like MFS transporter